MKLEIELEEAAPGLAAVLTELAEASGVDPAALLLASAQRGVLRALEQHGQGAPLALTLIAEHAAALEAQATYQTLLRELHPSMAGNLRAAPLLEAWADACPTEATQQVVCALADLLKEARRAYSRRKLRPRLPALQLRSAA